MGPREGFGAGLAPMHSRTPTRLVSSAEVRSAASEPPLLVSRFAFAPADDPRDMEVDVWP